MWLRDICNRRRVYKGRYIHLVSCFSIVYSYWRINITNASLWMVLYFLLLCLGVPPPHSLPGFITISSRSKLFSPSFCSTFICWWQQHHYDRCIVGLLLINSNNSFFFSCNSLVQIPIDGWAYFISCMNNYFADVEIISRSTPSDFERQRFWKKKKPEQLFSCMLCLCATIVNANRFVMFVRITIQLL